MKINIDNLIQTNIFLFIKIIIFLYCIYDNRNTFINSKNLISYLKYDFLKYEKYLNLLSKSKKMKIYKKLTIPKISIISPIYNRGKYILRFIKSIQYQNFNDLEIILVDDSSQDNSVKLIKEYKKIDERIKLLKNVINKGTFICRNLGVQYSLGNYVILPDPDDILSKNILKICYKLAIKNNYEIIRFIRLIYKNKSFSFDKIINNLGSRPIYQPELSNYMFYGDNNELKIIDFYINNKFIKRETYIKSLNILKKIYLNMYITFMEDSMITFIIYRTAKSFFFLKKFRYYYLRNSISITKNLNKISNLRLEFIFIYLKLVYNYSKMTKYDKDMANILFTNLNKFIEKNISNFKKYSYLFEEIINIYLKSVYITDENKYILKDYKKTLKKIPFNF